VQCTESACDADFNIRLTKATQPGRPSPAEYRGTPVDRRLPILRSAQSKAPRHESRRSDDTGSTTADQDVTKNAGVARDLLQDLVGRGLDPRRRSLFIVVRRDARGVPSDHGSRAFLDAQGCLGGAGKRSSSCPAGGCRITSKSSWPATSFYWSRDIIEDHEFHNNLSPHDQAT
jgi:hypothetical protein